MNASQSARLAAPASGVERRRPPAEGLDWRLWLLAGVVIAVLAGAIGALVHRQDDAAAAKLLQVFGRLKAAELELWLREREADARTLESTPLLSRLHQEWIDGNAASGADLRERLDALRRHGQYASLALLRPDATVSLELGEPFDAGSEALRAQLQRPAHEHFAFLPAGGQRAALHVAAWLPEQDHRPAPLVLARVDPAEGLAQILEDATLAGATLLLVAPDDAGIAAGVGAKGETALPPALAAVDAEAPVTMRTAEGREVLALRRPLAHGRLAMVALVDRAALDADGARTGWITGLATAALLAGGMALAIGVRQRRRVRAEAMRQRERDERLQALELLDALVGASPDAIFAKDLQGRYVLFNRAATRYTGKPAEAILGQDDAALLPSPEHEAVAARDQLVLREQRTITFEETLPTARGPVTFHTTKGPLYGADGRLAGLFGISRDVSERRAQEEERRGIAERLRESEAHYRSIVSALSEGIVEVGADGRVREVNASAERILGASAAQLRASLGYLDEWAAVREDGTYFPRDALPLFRTLATGKPQLGVVMGTTHPRSGRVVWLQANSEPVFDAHGRVDAVVLSFLDITERLAVERELGRHREHLEELVRQRTAMLEQTLAKVESFSYTISHDLRAPLRAIHGFATLLAAGARDRLDGEGRRLLERLIAAADKMNELLEDVQAYTRADRSEMKPEQVDLGTIAREVVAELAPAYPNARVEVGGLPTVWADPTMAHQVFANLVGNALKFSSKVAQPRIEIGCTRTAAGAEIHVRDNGAGFDMRYANQLFGLFKRLHREEEFPGTGLGLAIVKHLVERHGGHVRADAAEGRGATFSFTLGLAAPAGAGPEARAA